MDGAPSAWYAGRNLNIVHDEMEREVTYTRILTSSLKTEVDRPEVIEPLELLV